MIELITTNRIGLNIVDNILNIKRYSHTSNKGDDRFHTLNLDLSKGIKILYNEIDSDFNFQVYVDEISEKVFNMLLNKEIESFINI